MTELLCVVAVLLCAWSWVLTVKLNRIRALRAAELARGETDLAFLLRWVQAAGSRARHLDISQYSFGGPSYVVRVDRSDNGGTRTLAFRAEAATLADAVSSVVKNLRGES